MKLTVGPLPPAVYWRRRVTVLAALLLVVFLPLYSCSNRSDASRKKRVMAPASSKSSSPSPSPLASGSIFSPGTGLSAQADDPPVEPEAPAPSTPAQPAPEPAPSGPCTDAELTIVAAPAQASAASGAFNQFTLRIKNTSNRPCTRDVGGDAQELFLQDAAKAKVWSSDSCDTLHGTDVRTFAPAIEAQFYVNWDGKASNAGCADRKAPPAGKYQLVGRLATKLSEPAPVELK